MPPRLRRFVLTVHVATSVGWLGAAAAYFVLDVAAVTSQDVQTVRAAYLAMELVALRVIVPLAVAALSIGLLNALGTPWGLFRHYWVVFKLALTAIATLVLLQYLPTISALAAVAASGADPRTLPGSLLHSGGALVVLLVITALSVYKPPGSTPHGWRKQRKELRGREERRGSSIG